jgi:hypothetical protein
MTTDTTKSAAWIADYQTALDHNADGLLPPEFTATEFATAFADHHAEVRRDPYINRPVALPFFTRWLVSKVRNDRPEQPVGVCTRPDGSKGHAPLWMLVAAEEKGFYYGVPEVAPGDAEFEVGARLTAQAVAGQVDPEFLHEALVQAIALALPRIVTEGVEAGLFVDLSPDAKISAKQFGSHR